MAIADPDFENVEASDLGVRLKSFAVDGLFGYLDHKIYFPQMANDAAEPELLIVEGQNGTGKTTIMKMIAGMVNGLVFDTFRNVPFKTAKLELSTGDTLSVKFNSNNPEFPIKTSFRSHEVALAAVRGSDKYTPKQNAAIDEYRSEALPLLRAIDFDLLTIERAIAHDDSPTNSVYFDVTGRARERKTVKTLSARVRDFLRDAQVNYRRFFQAEELELLPRMLRQLSAAHNVYRVKDLQNRVYAVRENNQTARRFGLQTDERELETLSEILQGDLHKNDPHSLSLLSTYVEIHENRAKSRDLLTLRLSLFESIMDEFFVGKKIRVSAKTGFDIIGDAGRLSERDLSSGEFHFLYMMVAALLCERTGSIIAIDEPELSLHVSWQRRLVSALAKCASGAAPLFFLATHATAISSAHKHAVQSLSAID